MVAVVAPEQPIQRFRIGHGVGPALPVRARRYAASTRPTCLGMCCVADVSQIHTDTHLPSSECVRVWKRCDPYETRGVGIFSFTGRTHCRDDNSSSGTPRARTNSRELGGMCTSVHIHTVGASRVAKVADPALQTVHAVHPPEIRVKRGKFREIRRVFAFSKAVHRPCSSGVLVPVTRRPPRLDA